MFGPYTAALIELHASPQDHSQRAIEWRIVSTG